MTKQISVPTRLLNTPLMATIDEVNTIIGALSGAFSLSDIKELMAQRGRGSMAANGAVAVISIVGGLTYRGYGWYWGTTYGKIRKEFNEALADPQISAIVFDIDSPGGEVAGCFDLVDEIYNARGKKPIYAIANDDCYSAAYAIASAADKVYLTRTAGVGSVGVIAVHVEQSEFDKNIGVKYTPIFAGARKNDYSAHSPLSQKALEAAQASVDRTYDIFCETVARNRGLEVSAVRKTDAALFNGNDAVKAGLADTVMSWPEAITHIFDNLKEGEAIMDLKSLKTGMSVLLADTETRDEAVNMLGALGFVPAGETAQPDESALDTAREEGRTAGAEEMKKSAVEIIGICNLAGMDTMAGDLIKEGVSIEDARQKVTDAKASEGNGWHINGANSPTGNGGKNPLVEDAKRRAGKTE